MNISVSSKVTLKLGDKQVTLSREEAKELYRALQTELDIPPEKEYHYYPTYPWYDPSTWVTAPKYGTVVPSTWYPDVTDSRGSMLTITGDDPSEFGEVQ